MPRSYLNFLVTGVATICLNRGELNWAHHRSSIPPHIYLHLSRPYPPPIYPTTVLLPPPTHNPTSNSNHSPHHETKNYLCFFSKHY